ncbi:MAG: 1-acyl-sn-glycerol-3-phosphate acyltransferase [Bacteroidales bacterium]|nr:1-acyl-sn-glycerol-3-phosphate acyltransferase [Bacteroidales bacterium]
MKINSIGYLIFRELMRIPYTLFYRKVSVIGKEHVPKDKPIIFAPNHQNALMDPLAMIFSTPKQIVFLARGDIFKSNLLRKIFTFLKILPVYRQHDGKDALMKNEVVFQQSVDYLSRSGAFCLFPEAKHNPHRNLRPLKKGIPRIALQSLQATDFNIDIKIVPTGIYYENKDDARSYLQIKYGPAISVQQYVNAIKENEQRAMIKMSQDMDRPIRSLIMDIPEGEQYSNLELIRQYYSDEQLRNNKLKHNDENRFEVDQKLIAKIENHSIPDDIIMNVNELEKIAHKYKWKKEWITNPITSSTALLLSFYQLLISPFTLFGFLINTLPFYLIAFIIKNWIKDPQFISSIKFVIGGVLMPVYFFILSLFSWIFVPYHIAILILFSLPIVSFWSYINSKHLRWLWASFKIKNSTDGKLASDFYLTFIEKMNKWLAKIDG